MKGLVSIVCPAYNVSEVVSDTISSVLSQTYENWELLVCDDLSTDNTISVLEAWCVQDTRIKLLRNAVNTGPVGARNNCLKHASGEWIAFLDSDDIWHPEKLEKSLEFAKENNSAFVYTSYCRFRGAWSGSFGRKIKVPTSLSYRQLLSNTAIATSTVLINKDVVGEFSMRNTYYDDFDCWLSILKKGYVAFGLGEELMYYRMLPGSVSRNKFKSALHVWRAYRDLERLNLFRSIVCFVGYSFHAILKYR